MGRKGEGHKGRVALAVVLLAVIAAGVWVGAELKAEYQGYAPGGVFVEVERGNSIRGIARQLADAGVVRNRWVFEAVARWHKKRPLQAGEYFFSRAMSPQQVFDEIAAGRVYTQAFAVPEGLTMFEVADRADSEGVVSRAEFLAAAQDASQIQDLAPGARTLEGFLFPATYQLPRHVRARELVDLMVQRFREVWNGLRGPGANPYGLKPKDVVTMASLVEKEARKSDERPVVAGVFYNRMRRGYLLQCDPTVVYAQTLAGKWNGVLGKNDLKFDSPYNTYRYRGMPPGPIANPGEAALKAALYPPLTDYLYFVADTEGGHWFSKTLSEHNENVTRRKRVLAQIAAEERKKSE